jgi:hypothetical protein
MFDLRQFIRVLPVMALRLHAREVERAVRALHEAFDLASEAERRGV